MTIVDGKLIARELYEESKAAITDMSEPPRLAIITCEPNFETRKYLELKRRKAKDIGVLLTCIEVPATASTEDMIKTVEQASLSVDGLVVQLPLPDHIDRERVLKAVSPDQDPDCFSGAEIILPPVVGAIAEIAKRYQVEWTGKQVVVLGHGRLVGAPAALYAKQQGSTVTVLTEESEDTVAVLRTADILITGAGQPHSVSADMVKDGVVIFDAATSEDGGELRGDVVPAVAEKASLFTPVPGGIGPLTVAVLFRNLRILTERRRAS